MKEWKRVQSGVYQRIDNGVPQNVYIGRMGYTTYDGRNIAMGWQPKKMVDGKLKSVGNFYNTLAEAKAKLMDAE